MKSKKNTRQPVGPWVDKKINISQYIIAYYRDNYLKLKFVRGKKVDILTKEANANTIWNQSQTNFGLKKAYFWGQPVIQAVKAKMLGPYSKNLYFYKCFVPVSSISIHYELR